MRWERLFDDIEAQGEAIARAERDAEVADRGRAEYGQLVLADRLRPAIGAEIVLTVLGVGPVRGVLGQVGIDWLLITEPGQRGALVALTAVCAVAGLGATTGTAEPPGRVQVKLNLRWAVRGIARDRSPVALVLTDQTVLTGTIDRVGADFLELAEHPVAELRRAAAVRAVRTVALGAVAVVRTG